MVKKKKLQIMKWKRGKGEALTISEEWQQDRGERLKEKTTDGIKKKKVCLTHEFGREQRKTLLHRMK